MMTEQQAREIFELFQTLKSNGKDLFAYLARSVDRPEGWYKIVSMSFKNGEYTASGDDYGCVVWLWSKDLEDYEEEIDEEDDEWMPEYCLPEYGDFRIGLTLNNYFNR